MLVGAMGLTVVGAMDLSLVGAMGLALVSAMAVVVSGFSRTQAGAPQSVGGDGVSPTDLLQPRRVT
jgi:hypothetical protein